MLDVITKTINKPWLQFSIALGIVLFSPLTVIAGAKEQSCETARKNIDRTKSTLRPLKHQQQQIQQHVRTIYQELFTCQTRTELSLTQRNYCTQLQKEGSKQFQAMLEVTTRNYQTSQQLAHQTHQLQLACPTITEHTFPKITRLKNSK